MPQMAGFFYAGVEERDHAMMMVQYLLDSHAQVVTPGVDAPEPVRRHRRPGGAGVEQEKRVTGQINELTAISRDENDFASDQFMQWFIKEQVEEVSTMSDLVTVVRRARNDVEAIEDYILREHRSVARGPVRPRDRRSLRGRQLRSFTLQSRRRGCRAHGGSFSGFRLGGVRGRRVPGLMSGRVAHALPRRQVLGPVEDAHITSRLSLDTD